MTEQKDINIKDKIKRELSRELNTQKELVIYSSDFRKNDTSKNSKKCFLSSSVSSKNFKLQKKQEHFPNKQEFNRNNGEIKFWFLDSLANFLVSDVYTLGSVRSDTMNSAIKSNIRNVDMSRELDVDTIKSDDKKCKIVRAFLLEMEIAAIIIPSYRVKKCENNHDSGDKKDFCCTDLTEIRNRPFNGFQTYVNSDDEPSDSSGNTCNNNNNNISVNHKNNNDNDNDDDNRSNNDNKNNKKINDDYNDNNENEENINRNLTSDFIRSLNSLNIIFISTLPVPDPKQFVLQNTTNLRKNCLDDTKDNQNRLQDHRTQNNFNFNDMKCTKKNTKNVKNNNITTICIEKEQVKLYQILSVCFCAIIDTFITSYQENLSKKSISETTEYFYTSFITNPNIKLSLVKISNLFYDHQNQNNIQYLQRNFWSRICSVHLFSDAISELSFRIISNPHFSQLFRVTSSTTDKTLLHIKENGNENKKIKKNIKESKMKNEKIRVEKDDDLFSTSKNSRSARKRKHNSLPSILLTPNNSISLLSSTSTSTSSSTSIPQLSMSSSPNFSFITSLPQIRKTNKNGVRNIVVESRTLGNTESMKAEFVNTEINLTDPLLWEELLDSEVVENLCREGKGEGGERGVGLGGGVNVKGDRRKEGEGEEVKGKGKYTLVEDMRKELSETERNHSGKTERHHPSGKKIKVEKEEILEIRKLKMNKKTTFKDTEDEIRLLEVGGNNRTPLFQNVFDKSVQNNDNNVITYVNTNMSHGDNQSVIDDDRNNKNNNSNNIQKSDNRNNKNDILIKSKVETFHHLPIYNSTLNATTKSDRVEFNVIKKGKKVELSIVNPIPTPIPSTTIPKINVKNIHPENILQNNTEAAWNKKDINKKWSMSF